MTFEEFSRANRERCEAPNGFRRLVGRDVVPHMIIGLAEEAGEVAGKVRSFLGMSGRKVPATPEEIGAELADLVSYADLLAQSLSIDLGAALVDKFNTVSERMGYPKRLVPATQHRPGGGAT